MSNKNNDIFWVRKDPFGNAVSLHVARWEQHISKHEFDKYPVTEEHIYQAIIDPDQARRSLDPIIANEACIFEKFFQAEQQLLLVPVLYEEVIAPYEYEEGGKKGKVLTAYFPDQRGLSSTVGPVFWTKSDGKKEPSE